MVRAQGLRSAKAWNWRTVTGQRQSATGLLGTAGLQDVTMTESSGAVLVYFPARRGTDFQSNPPSALRPSHPLGRFQTRTYHNGDVNHAFIMVGNVPYRSPAATSMLPHWLQFIPTSRPVRQKSFGDRTIPCFGNSGSRWRISKRERVMPAPR